MTQRDFLTTIKNGIITDEIMAYAAAELDRLDERTGESCQASSPESDAEMKLAIFSCFVRGCPMTSKEIAEAVDITPQKARAILKQLADENFLIVTQMSYGQLFVDLYSLA